MNLLQIHEPGETPLPHEASVAIGIDLGTTHSVAAVARDGIATLLRDADGSALVPSIVAYGKEGTVVGKEAYGRLEKGDRNTVASIKRLMGRSRKDAESFGLTHTLAGEEGGMVRLEIAGQARSPVEISGDILHHLKLLAETSLGQDVTKAVITVPAYFDDAARAATKDAAKLAGIEVLRLINEPTAAALAYGLDNGAEGIYAVYDLGGGTFDISILKLEKGVFQVLSTGGDIALGGDDFDRAIAALLFSPSPSRGEGRDGGDAKGKVDATGITPTLILPPQRGGNIPPALLHAARKVKERLSDAPEATLEWNKKSKSVTRGDLERLMQPFVAKSLIISAQALEDAKLGAKDICGVVLVGGSTRSPFVRAQVEAFFGKAPLADINPDEVVAVGAAIQAESLTQGGDHLLLDVVPLSLGLETMGGLVEKIIHRNTPIPVAAQQSFTTYKDGQNGMIIHIVQGEREMVDQNRSLARFELSGIPPLPAGIARVKVSFTIDADGLLSVGAREETTGVEQNVAVKPSYGLAEGEIERMLYESMEHAKEDIIGRLLFESKMEAGRSIEEVKSALARDGDLLDTQELRDIQEQIGVLEEAAKETDRNTVDREAERLHHLTRPFAEKRMDRAITSALKGAHVDDVAPMAEHKRGAPQ